MYNKMILNSFLIMIFVTCTHILAKNICTSEEKPMPGISYVTMNETYHNYFVFIAFWDDEVGFKTCDGILFNYKYVITTAECLQNVKCIRDQKTRKFECVHVPASQYDVVQSRTCMICSDPAQVRVGKKIYLPGSIEHGNKNKFSYNIAILEVTQKFPSPGIQGENSIQQGVPFSGGGNICKVVGFGQSYCTKFLTKKIRNNGYTFTSGERFRNLWSYNLKEFHTFDDTRACDAMFDNYVNSGYIFNKTSFYCALAQTSSEDCQYFPGTAVICPYGSMFRLLGIMMQQLSCYYAKHPMLVLKLEIMHDIFPYEMIDKLSV